jgi:hypothetical protein
VNVSCRVCYPGSAGQSVRSPVFRPRNARVQQKEKMENQWSGKPIQFWSTWTRGEGMDLPNESNEKENNPWGGPSKPGTSRDQEKGGNFAPYRCHARLKQCYKHISYIASALRMYRVIFQTHCTTSGTHSSTWCFQMLLSNGKNFGNSETKRRRKN